MINHSPITTLYLRDRGFECNNGVFVRKGSPRLGYVPGTKECIIGFASVGGVITEQWQMDGLLKIFKLK